MIQVFLFRECARVYLGAICPGQEIRHRKKGRQSAVWCWKKEGCMRKDVLRIVAIERE